jgi:uroporphyrinogen-III decarboxylase
MSSPQLSAQAAPAKPWAELSWQEKREQRFQTWLSAPGITFSGPEAKKGFEARVTRLVKCLRLEKPDRVPCILPAGQFPLHYAGTTTRIAMYNYEEMKRAWRMFQRDFDSDTCVAPTFDVSSGRTNEIIQTQMMKWPGHGLGMDADMAQFVEGEYMKADEYDHLLKDPGDFFWRVCLPRTLFAFKPFRKLAPFRGSIAMPNAFLGAATQPDVREAFQAIIDAGKELEIFQQAQMEVAMEGQAAGFPMLMGGMAAAPFDFLGDTLRGTHGIMTDIFRQPDKIHEAMEVITPWIVEGALAQANASGRPLVFFALHKGDDAFISDKNFEIFYWPSLKKVILQLVAEGCVPLLFAEGRMNRRLEAIKDLPKSSVLWWFDRTDMARAKQVLGDVACISGNVPASMMCLGTPQEVKEYCRKLIEDCAKNGGFILTGGSAAHKTTAAHLRAMMDAVKEYGVYQ